MPTHCIDNREHPHCVQNIADRCSCVSCFAIVHWKAWQWYINLCYLFNFSSCMFCFMCSAFQFVSQRQTLNFWTRHHVGYTFDTTFCWGFTHQWVLYWYPAIIVDGIAEIMLNCAIVVNDTVRPRKVSPNSVLMYNNISYEHTLRFRRTAATVIIMMAKKNIVQFYKGIGDHFWSIHGCEGFHAFSCDIGHMVNTSNYE